MSESMDQRSDTDILQQLLHRGGEAVSGLVNRVLQLDPASAQRLAALEGKRLRLDLTGSGQSVLVLVSDRQLRLSLLSAREAGESIEPDTVVSGRPGDLFAAAAPDWGHSDSGVTIRGDTGLARDLQKLLQQLDPDWEAPLAQLLGDVAGHQVAKFARAGRSWLQRAAESTAAAGQDFLRYENDALVSAPEFDRFSEQVETTRDAVDRAEARLKRLESHLNS